MRENVRNPGLMALIATAILALALCGVAIYRSDGGSSPAATPPPADPISSPAACDRVTLQAQKLRPDIAVSNGTGAVVALGDSYTASSRTAGWTTSLARSKGWRVYVNGISGTGFTSGGPCGNQQYATRVDAVLGQQPTRVVVQGGLNDTRAPDDRLSEATRSLLTSLQRVPSVVVVGPPPAPAVEGTARVDQVLRAETQRAGRQYVSTQTWQLPYRPDGVHPTPEGYDLFGTTLAAQLAG